MASAKRYVKYMVSLRCKMVLREELIKAGIKFAISPHGAIEFKEDVTPSQLEELNRNILKSGLELLGEMDSLLIDHIINTIVEVVHDSDELPNLSFTDIIDTSLRSGNENNNGQVLKIFSDVKGISVIQYIVVQKVERVKEFLLYDDLTMAEISERLRYKNEHYMAAQFKKITGLSPTYFKKLRNERMKILQKV